MEMLRTTSGLLSASQAHGSQERTWGKDHFHPSIPSDWGFRGSSAGKESACNTRDPGSIPGLGRSPVEGYSFLLGREITGLNSLSPFGQSLGQEDALE